MRQKWVRTAAVVVGLALASAAMLWIQPIFSGTAKDRDVVPTVELNDFDAASHATDNKIDVRGRLESNRKSHRVIVVDDMINKPGEYWVRPYVGCIDPDGRFDVVIDEIVPGGGKLRLLFCFDNGIVTGDGERHGLPSAIERAYRKVGTGFEFDNQDPEVLAATSPDEPLAWGAKVSAEFKAKVVEICQSLEIDPNHLMAAMAFESAESFSPSIKNAAGSGATGLIQFMPRTAQGLGTSVEELARMDAVEQLDYVELYFKPFRGRCQSLDDVYMAILWPAAIGKPDEFVLFAQEKQPNTYRQNRGLDRDGDGRVTKSEAGARVRDKLEKGLREEFRG